MADYIYLLQNRLSPAQQAALQTIRDVSKAHSLTVFLVGGAVRDLTSGSPVRDLDMAVQGNALKLKKDIELAGATIVGEVASWQAFFAHFPGGVRVEIGGTLSVTYPKPGKPVAQGATILDDLRRRDFTANAMALSLNDGSYGLLMDPLNGVADIENRLLRLVSNYGFIEDPVRMIRATRYAARLGWAMDEKTQSRYETGKAEKYIGTLSVAHRGYETEEIFHEEDPLRVLRKLEEEGWMKHLFPALTVAKANAVELERLREVQTQLQVSGINPDAAAANFPLLTAKLSAPEVAELKKSFVRQGFVREIENLEAEAKEFASQLTGKGAASPSQAWKLIHAAKPEAVLWVAYSSKSPAVQAKFKSFHTEWPKARQKVPFALMQEMRIVPELDGFDEVVEKVFFELMDGNLTTPEEQKVFLEPFSPPAPPPPVRLSRSRAGKKDGKAAKGKKKLAEPIDEDDENADLDREHDREHDEDDEDAAPLTDDENENAGSSEPSLKDEVDELPVRTPARPEPIPDKAPAAPAALIDKNIAAPLAVESGVPMKTTPAVKAVPATAPEKAPMKQAKVTKLPAEEIKSAVKSANKAIVMGKASAKLSNTPAKEAAAPASTPQRSKAAPPPEKKVSAKETAPSTARSAAKQPVPAAAPAKAAARKVVAIPAKVAGKKRS